MVYCNGCSDKNCPFRSLVDAKCSRFKQKTNADRIRSMTDEELAELLRDYQCNTCDFIGFCEQTDKCKEEIFKWLKEECES